MQGIMFNKLLDKLFPPPILTGRCPCSIDYDDDDKPIKGTGCCDDPDPYCPPHTCEYKDFCEECFWEECRNCGSGCCCDL